MTRTDRVRCVGRTSRCIAFAGENLMSIKYELDANNHLISASLDWLSKRTLKSAKDHHSMTVQHTISLNTSQKHLDIYSTQISSIKTCCKVFGS